MILKKTRETRNELTTDELDLVSGGVPGIGIAYGHSPQGQAIIAWGGKGGTWVVQEGKDGATWVPN
jgi:hypothetical protein